MEFTPGTKISLMYGNSAEIIRKLGKGGQGIVYEVKIDGKPYALKWYTNEKIIHNTNFKKNLKNNIQKGSPDKRFLWPLYLTDDVDGSYGYIMDLRPQEYSKFPAILNNRAKFTNDEIIILAALNIVTVFRILHNDGSSYQDLNDGSFFINVNTGDVLVCDNDNVTPGDKQNSGGVKGKLFYMAPEVVTGGHPSILSDCHSLAVVLFKLFIRHDPFMGIADDGDTSDEVLYGTHPVFIFDPKDTSNRPYPDYKNPLLLWPRKPRLLQEAFEKSFTSGLKNPGERLTELEWQKVLIKLRDECILCPTKSCNKTTLHEENGSIACKDCGNIYKPPSRLFVGEYSIPLFQGKRLYACHTVNLNTDYTTITGKVVKSKNAPYNLGIQNLTDDIWTFTWPDGKTDNITKGNVIPIGVGVEISFKGVTGKIALRLVIDNKSMPLYRGQKLFAKQTRQNYSDSKLVTGKVVMNKNTPGILGLQNLTDDIWTFTWPDGKNEQIAKNGVIPIGIDVKITFSGITGIITR
ncbi:hypothetical protein AGMMS50268_39600 [Spirochaetia bacterium]|nr:hypothetical protein AGMMS50268_39600 [Spirochaetia bacterium]